MKYFKHLFHTEDVVGSSVGHFFSDDDAYMVYVKYNDTGVPLQSWPEYGPKEDVYGDVISIAYPKVRVFLLTHH